MAQICPDCGEKYPDDCNYCVRCRAKLPNARKDLLDYKSLLNIRGDNPELSKELREYVIRIAMSPKYHTAVFINITQRSEKGSKSDSEYEQYLSSEIMKVLLSTLNEELPNLFMDF